MQQNVDLKFPRKLSEREKNWLLAALPENKLGYKQYRDIIETLSVIGLGRFGEGNYILGQENDEIDLNISSTPIFAVATIAFDVGKIYVAIHEELDGQIEVDINATASDMIPDDLSQAKVWTYSNWIPGKKAPFDNTHVREIHLVKNEIILVIAPAHKKVWVYNSKSGINHFVPVTNFYNEMIMQTNIKDTEIALNPGKLFSNLDDFSDEQLIEGFLVYNKYWKRVELDYHLFEKKNRKNSFFDFFAKN